MASHLRLSPGSSATPTPQFWAESAVAQCLLPDTRPGVLSPSYLAAYLLGTLHQAEAAVMLATGADPSTDHNTGRNTERPAHVRLIRCTFGNPFRPAHFDPAWRTSAVAALAGPIYADRAFDRLPILADALEDAGCDDQDMLTHCRTDPDHARGCWVVDLILGKN
jgi:hypothetical protein